MFDAFHLMDLKDDFLGGGSDDGLRKLYPSFLFMQYETCSENSAFWGGGGGGREGERRRKVKTEH